MNKIIKISFTILVFVLFVAFSSATTAADNLKPVSLKPLISGNGKIINNTNPGAEYRIDPNPLRKQVRIPARFNLNNLPATPTATFSISYAANGDIDYWGSTCSTFPEEAKAALNAATAVWSNLLQTNAPLTIHACWSDALSSEVLGRSEIGNIICFVSGDPTPTPQVNVCYANALANRFVGYNYSGGMEITYNSTFPWYFGTDGLTPSGQYDLMTAALHTITHGLNFSGSMNVASGLGNWGYGYGSSPNYFYPNIYDTFMKDAANDPSSLLIDTSIYPKQTTTLATALTSNSVWFDGPNAVSANGGKRVKIYAPSPWQDDASYIHLDYDTFAGTVNGLMVNSLSPGTSIHDPGPVTLGMLKDIGWGWTGAPPPPYYADLGISVVKPVKVYVGQTATYTITVINNGPNAAQNSIAMFSTENTSYDAKISSINAIPSQGSCYDNCTCNLGIIASGASSTITVNATPITTGMWVSTVLVRNDITDLNPVNDEADLYIQVVNPAPATVSLKPASANKGGAGFTLTVNGSNFVSNSQVQWNGVNRATTFVSCNQLTAQILPDDLTATGTATVTIVNPAPEGGTSNAETSQSTIHRSPMVAGAAAVALSLRRLSAHHWRGMCKSCGIFVIGYCLILLSEKRLYNSTIGQARPSPTRLLKVKS